MQTPTNETVQEVAARYPEDLANPDQHFNDFGTDFGFACHSQVLSAAFKDNAYRYVMSISPATHQLDQWYYFYINNDTAPTTVEVDIARRFQAYLRDFIVGGDPNVPSQGPKPGLSDGNWPVYGSNASIFNITSDGFMVSRDPPSFASNCEFIQGLIQDCTNGW
jgi:carboxylesterase type B